MQGISQWSKLALCLEAKKQEKSDPIKERWNAEISWMPLLGTVRSLCPEVNISSFPGVKSSQQHCKADL